MTVSLLEILAAARAHAAPLAAESAGYLLLAVADHVVGAPRSVSAAEVELQPDGNVKVRAPQGAATADVSVERGVRALLAQALAVSSSVGPALRRASERREDVGLPALVRELETALIPVNRSAARRALSRLHRETARARDAGRLVLAAAVTSEVVAREPATHEPATREPATRATLVPVPVELPLPSADVEEPSPVLLPAVEQLPTPRPRAAIVVAPEPPVLTLTPEPQLAMGEPALTKPEPVVLRQRERGNRTPRLGTVVTAITLPGDEERTEVAPAVDEELPVESSLLVVTMPQHTESDAGAALLSTGVGTADDLDVEVVVDLSEPASHAAAEEPQTLDDPEPSRMPDVLMAMVQLHTGLDADEAPTRLREVVTALVAELPPSDAALESPYFPVQTSFLAPEAIEPALEPVRDAALSGSGVDELALGTPQDVAAPSFHQEEERALEPFEEASAPSFLEAEELALDEVEELASADAEELALDEVEELASADAEELALDEVEELASADGEQPAAADALGSWPEPAVLFQSELAAPEVHDALTWNPGPVVTASANHDFASSVPAAFLIAEPLPELSPYAPAVLPARSSDVSELLDSFYVSDAAEEHELRSALKEMAGLSLTPLPLPLIEEG